MKNFKHQLKAFIDNAHTEFEYRGDDLYEQIMSVNHETPEDVFLPYMSVVYLPDMSREIGGHAFAEANFQLAWTMVETEGGIYDVTRYFLDDFRSRYGVASASNDLKLSDEIDTLLDIMGSHDIAASSTAGWRIYRVSNPDGSQVWYWHEPNDGADNVRIDSERAFEIAFGCDGFVNFGYGMGQAWHVVATVVRARQSGEYDDDSIYSDEIEALSSFRFGDVFFPGSAG